MRNRRRPALLVILLTLLGIVPSASANGGASHERYTRPFVRRSGIVDGQRTAGRRVVRMPRRIQRMVERSQAAAPSLMDNYNAAVVAGATSRLQNAAPEITATVYSSFLAGAPETQSNWVRRFDGTPGEVRSLVERAWEVARTSLADGKGGVLVEPSADGSAFVTVDLAERVGTVTPREGQANHESVASHVTLLLQGGRLFRAYPAHRPRGFPTRRAALGAVGFETTNTRTAFEREIVAPLGHRAIERYVGNVSQPYRRNNFEPRGHAVFFGGLEAANEVVQEAWTLARSAYAAGGAPGVVIDEASADGATFVTVDMGRPIGYIGGRVGELNATPAGDEVEYPVADRVQMVMENGEIKMAYPMSRGPLPQRFQGGPTVNGVPLPELAAPVAVAHPRRTLTAEQVGDRLAAAALSGPATSPAVAETRRRIALRGSRKHPSLAARTRRGPMRHVMLGLPSEGNAAQDRLVMRNAFVASNRAGVGVNWVSYSVDASDMGAVERSEDFRSDPTMPEDHAGNRDEAFGELGRLDFHRGHLRSAGSTNAIESENSSTFTYANVIPQAANNNTGAWNGLEQYQRLAARQGYVVHTVDGALYLGNTWTAGDGLRVPSHTYKVMVLTRPGARNTIPANTRVIAILMPNNNFETSKDDDWTKYRVAPSVIEGLSARADNAGAAVRFFTHLPAGVAEGLRAQTDTHEVPTEIAVMRSYLDNSLDRTFGSIRHAVPGEAARRQRVSARAVRGAAR